MLQAAKRAGAAALGWGQYNPRPTRAIESALSAGLTSHGGLGPRRTPATWLPRPLLECRMAGCSADDRGPIRQGAPAQCGCTRVP